MAQLWWQLRLCTGLASATVLEQQQLLPPLATAFQGAAADTTAEPAGGSRVRVEVPVEVPVDLSPGAAGQQVSVALQQAGQAGQAGQDTVRVNVDVSQLVGAVQAGMQASGAAAPSGAPAAGAGAGNGTAGGTSGGGSGGSGSSSSSSRQPTKKTIKALPRVSPQEQSAVSHDPHLLV